MSGRVRQVPTVRDALLKRDDWQRIAQQQLATTFARNGTALNQARLEAFMRALDLPDDDAVHGAGITQVALPLPASPSKYRF